MNQKRNKTLNLLFQFYTDNNIEKIENFDDAIIGVDVNSKRLIYSVKKCIKTLKLKIATEQAVDCFYSEIYSEENLEKAIFCEDYLTKTTNI